MLDVTLAAEYRRIVVIKELAFSVGSDGSKITVFDDRNIFRISFTPFYLLVELGPTFTFIV